MGVFLWGVGEKYGMQAFGDGAGLDNCHYCGVFYIFLPVSSCFTGLLLDAVVRESTLRTCARPCIQISETFLAYAGILHIASTDLKFDPRVLSFT